MNKFRLACAAAALLLLAGCNNGLSAQDRATLNQAAADAQAAREQAAASAAAAQQAERDAAAAKSEAQVAEEKSVRIFEHGGDK